MCSGGIGPRLFSGWRLVALFAGLHGCGDGTPDPGGDIGRTSPNQVGERIVVETPPVAAIDAVAERSNTEVSAADISPGSPEARLLEITKMVAAVEAGSSGSVDDAALRRLTQQRLERVIELATQVIAATHEHPEQEQLFNNAVHYLSDARLELASAGDEAQAALLIEDAESLFERDATSFAAAEAGFKVVELAGRMAESFGADDPDWLSEYANQSIRFAQRFPVEEGRAAMSLFAAGRTCDRLGAPEAARQCLELLRRNYAGSVFAEQSAGLHRRLTLPGQPLELSGPTIDGGFVKIQQYAGRPVLVVFWASTSPTFLKDLPVLRQIEEDFAGRGLSIIGVNLDTVESAVDRFLTDHGLSWPQIFYSDPEQRAGRNPVARYYSLQIVPTYWLVDTAGNVVSAPHSVADLPKEVQELINER